MTDSWLKNIIKLKTETNPSHFFIRQFSYTIFKSSSYEFYKTVLSYDLLTYKMIPEIWIWKIRFEIKKVQRIKLKKKKIIIYKIKETKKSKEEKVKHRNLN